MGRLALFVNGRPPFHVIDMFNGEEVDALDEIDIDPDSQSPRPIFTREALATASRAFPRPHFVAADDLTETLRLSESVVSHLDDNK